MEDIKNDPKYEPLVKISRLSLNLGLKTVLRQVSLEVYPGQKIALLGPGGSSKSVLMSVISTLIIPVFGKVRLMGHQVRRQWGLLEKLRAGIGMQFQNFALFDDLSVLENLAFPLFTRDSVPRDEALAQAALQLDNLGLGHAGDLRVWELSGGMKRRVAVGRAIMGSPVLALFDDPISGLDPRSTASVLDYIFQTRSSPGMATIVAGNDPGPLLKRVDRVWLLWNGRLVFDGLPQEFMQSRLEPMASFLAASRMGEGEV